MATREQEEQKAQYLRCIFDTIPMPAFVVDADVCIFDFNTSAERFLGPEPSAMLYRRGGEAFHCIHSELNGCGKAAPCQDCAIRNGVAKAMTGGSTWRELHAAELRTEHGSVSIDMLVTASLLPYTEPLKALLILEDVTETTRAARR